MNTAESGRTYRVLFYCSTSVVAPLVDNAEYPQIVADYQRTFERLRTFEADVFLANHPAFFEMAVKRGKRTAGGPILHIVQSKQAAGRDKDRFFLATHAEALRQLLGHEE